MIRGFVSAVRTLTVIPIFGKDAEDLSDAVVWFPFVGFLLAGILVIFIKVGLYLTNWYQLIAFFSVFSIAFLTRGIHLDGLADSADAFGGGYDKTRILSIMKDSSIGTFGSLALIFVVLIKWIAVLKIIHSNDFLLFFPVYVTSRFSMSYLASTTPYVRREGGTAQPFVKNAGTKDAVVAFIISLILSAITAKGVGVALLFAGFFITLLLKLFYIKKVGGITGDMLGATAEITESVLLVLAFYFSSCLKGFLS